MDQVIKKHNFIRLSSVKYDIEKMKKEVIKAEKKHQFLQKVSRGWQSIPLRSVGGEEGKRGNLGGGFNNSANPADYKYTTVMECCPYIKHVLESFGSNLYKVRIMKLIRGKKIGAHIDGFADDKIIRFHIPIVTDDQVRFIVEKEDQNLEEGHLYWVNVRKEHRVLNNSKKIDRIHLVFDMERNVAIEKLFEKNENNYLR